MDLTIVAGRFAPLAGAFAYDLGTGERVCLRVDVLDEPPRQTQWAEACGFLCGLWHPSLAECLDFGLVSSTHRFSAFRASRHASARVPAGSWERLRREVGGFLQAAGVQAGTLAQPFVDGAGRQVVVPDPGEPPSIDAAAVRESWGLGVRLVRQPALQAITELLTLEPPRGISLHQVEAAPGGGGRTFLRLCAGEARRRGYMPVHSGALLWMIGQPLARSWLAVLSTHHLAVLHDGRRAQFEERPDLLRALLRIAARGAQPRIVIELVASHEPRAPLRLLPLDGRELTEMLVLPGVTRPERRTIDQAARRSRGRPGVFIDRLLRVVGRSGAPSGPPSFTVHESRTEYAHGRTLETSGPPRAATSTNGSGPETASLASAFMAAALWKRGRHEAADRSLRQSEAAAARRGCWGPAADLAVVRARAARARGHVSRAEQALFDAIEHAERAADVPRCLGAVVETGCLLLEDARLEPAESSLQSALVVSRVIGDGLLACRAAAVLALCFWWQGRFEEARTLLAQQPPPPSPATPGPAAWWGGGMPHERLCVWWHCASARAALALNDPAAAKESLVRAASASCAAGDPWARTLVLRMEARWCAWVGDGAGFTGAVRESERVAREARLPIERLRALATCFEGSLRLRLRDGLPAAARRLARAARRPLPGLLAMRIRVALAHWSGARPPDHLAAECRARRLAALPMLCLPPPPAPLARVSHPRSPMYDDVIEVMRVCQEEEAGEAVKKVLALVRDRTRAAAADFRGSHGIVLGVQPAAARPTCASARAIETELAVAPVADGAGVEAAVLLRFTGRAVGALGCRWCGTPPIEMTRLLGFLDAVAAAAAPCVSCLLEAAEPAPAVAAAGPELLGESAALQEIRRAVARAAAAPFPVLIQGESGSGKELVARAIHRASPRRQRPLCALNCAALPDDLLEAELFGHARGAFTGAVAERAGLFEEADGGVLFLDEVGELSPRAQAKLLRAIQEGEVKRLGETFARRVDARIVAATNRPLEEEVAAGRFRRDLRYRLDVIRIVVPPLRERPDDIPVLAQHFWKQAAARVGSRAQLGSRVLSALAGYDWPGNVRELQNVLASLAVSAPRRGIVGPGALPAVLATQAARGPVTTLDAARKLFEERFVRAALARTGGHRGRAAAELGLTRQGLAKLMGRLGMAVDGPAGSGAQTAAS